MNNIVIWAQTNYNWLWIPLAKKFKDEKNVNVHFICSTPQSIRYWKSCDRFKVVDTYITTNHFFFEYDRYPDSFIEIYAQARDNERRYGTSLVDVLQGDRHLGRGFFSAGIGHPKSDLSKKASYVKSANIFNKAISFWEDYFRRVKPDLIIGVTSGVIGKTCAVVARKRSIPVRALTPSKYQSYFYWGVDEYYSFPDLEKNFNSIQNYKNFVTVDEISNMKRLPWTEQNYQKYIQYRSVSSLCKRILDEIKKNIYRRYTRVVTMGNYKWLENVRYIYRMHREMRKIDRLKTGDTRDLKDIPYIFYPLHVEPETALGMLSPEFNEQMALIEFLAKNLPAGTFLVVKEHLAAIGRRPRDFYSTLLEIPNLIMVHPCSCALDVARGAISVAAITSTLGLESAILGIPVISFGIHNNFNFLPHVYVVESWKELRPLLHKLCLEEDTKEAKTKRQEDGKRFLAALKVSSVDLSWSNYSSKKREPATEKEVEVLYSSLMKSLEL